MQEVGIEVKRISKKKSSDNNQDRKDHMIQEVSKSSL